MHLSYHTLLTESLSTLFRYSRNGANESFIACPSATDLAVPPFCYLLNIANFNNHPPPADFTMSDTEPKVEEGAMTIEDDGNDEVCCIMPHIMVVHWGLAEQFIGGDFGNEETSRGDGRGGSEASRDASQLGSTKL